MAASYPKLPLQPAKAFRSTRGRSGADDAEMSACRKVDSAVERISVSAVGCLLERFQFQARQDLATDLGRWLLGFSIEPINFHHRMQE